MLGLSTFLALVGRILRSVVPDAFFPKLLYITGLGLFALAAWAFMNNRRLPKWLTHSFSRIQIKSGFSGMRLALLLAAPLMSYGAWLAAGEQGQMRVFWLAIGLWILGIAFVLGSVVELTAIRISWQWPRWEIGLFLTFVTIAGLTRLPDLAQIPWQLTGDEGNLGLVAVEYINGARNNIFNVGWDSWPSFYVLVPASSIALLGQTATALRLPSAIAGVLTVAALYPLARSMFDRSVAIVATAYLSVFHLHIHFSRIGMHAVWDGLLVTLVTFALLVAWQRNSRTLFVVAGLLMGFSFFFYASARSFALLIPIWLGVAFIRDREAFPQRLPGLAAMATAVIVVCLPLSIFYLNHPNEFFAPLQRQSVFGGWLEHEVSLTGHSEIRILIRQFIDSASAFTELNSRGFYSTDTPMLMAGPATFFLMGVVLVALKVPSLRHVWLLLWLGTAVLAGALSTGTPAAQRYVYTAPAVAMIIAIGLTRPAHWLALTWPQWSRIFVGLVAVTVIIMAFTDLHYYFQYYTSNRWFGDRNTLVAQEVAHYLREEGPPDPVYFSGSPHMSYRSHGSLPFLAPDYTGIDVTDPFSAWLSDHGRPEPPFTFVGVPENSDTVMWLRMNFPQGTFMRMLGPEGDYIFWNYEVSAP